MKSTEGVSSHDSNSLLTSEAKLLLEEIQSLGSISHSIGMNLSLAGNVWSSSVSGDAVSSASSEWNAAVQFDLTPSLTLEMMTSMNSGWFLTLEIVGVNAILHCDNSSQRPHISSALARVLQ